MCVSEADTITAGSPTAALARLLHLAATDSNPSCDSALQPHVNTAPCTARGALELPIEIQQNSATQNRTIDHSSVKAPGENRCSPLKDW